MDEFDLIRSKTKDILAHLDNEITQTELVPRTNAPTHLHSSWVRGKLCPSIDEYPTRRCQFFDKHGFLLIKSFADDAEISSMKLQMTKLVEEEWDPNGSNKKLTVFRTDDKQIEEQGSNNYFLDSANKVHFFAESRALDDNGKLKESFINNKIEALNKAGHGLHIIPGAFHTYTTSEKVKHLVKELGWVDPVIPQSMYIFKQARVGGEVTSHQDSTFLYTTPKQTCLGLWLALDDATLENGCLWVRPGSHQESLRRKFTRNPLHFRDDVIESRGNVAKGDLSQSQMIFVNEPNSHNVPWEGAIPDDLLETGFIPIECKAGDVVVFPGQLDHLSLPNTSACQRHTFQLHLVEGDRAGITWSKGNWLQYPPGDTFLSIT